jgi:cysteine desulfurase
MIPLIYLDNAATTMTDPAVLEAMLPYLKQQYGNAGSLYHFGRSSAVAVAQARSQVAELLHAQPEQIVFTSGGSEANSLVFSGLRHHLKQSGKTHILISATEHDSVRKAAAALVVDGFTVETLPVTHNGVVSPTVLERAIRPDTGLVSIMCVNNETGTVNPTFILSQHCHDHGVLFHTDAVQAVGYLHVDVEETGCDFLSASSHKLHGGHGSGCLFVRDRTLLTSLIHGGAEQESGLRGGTENVPAIVGFGAACALVTAKEIELECQMAPIKSIFLQTFLRELDDIAHKTVRVNGSFSLGDSKTLSLFIAGVDAQSLVLLLDNYGICISAGSACRSHETEPSHVLLAMGLSEEEARSSVRISFSRMNTVEEVKEAAKQMASCVQFLREKGGFC